MFASVDLARRIDRAEARLSAEIARVVAARRPAAQVFVEEIAGGVAAFAGNDSPVNKLIGVGFDAPVDGGALAAIEAEFDQRGARLQAEVSTLANPSWHTMLCGRGYVLQGFENVLGRRIAAEDSPSVAPGERVVESLDDSEIPLWATMLVDGFEQLDVQGVPGDQIPPRDVVEQVTTTAPGSKSQENFQKLGFSLMYSRALLVRPPRS